MLEAGENPNNEASVKPRGKAEAKPLKKYKIVFHGEGGDVEIAHNFKLNLYKRNVETTIDENYLGVLKDAVVKTIVEDAEGNRRNVSIPQYQYTVEPL